MLSMAIVEANRASVDRVEELNTRRGLLRAERDKARKEADDCRATRALAAHDKANYDARVLALDARREAIRENQEKINTATTLALDALKTLEKEKSDERATADQDGL